jgi:hypothetical protein
MSDPSQAIAANTKFTETNIPELAAEICELISIGYGLKEALETNLKFPKATAFYKWLEKYPDVAYNYMRAREMQQDYEADNIITIADTQADSNKARVMIDARKWRASKLAPKKYGDKQEIAHSGSITTIKGISDSELELIATGRSNRTPEAQEG